MPVIPVNNLGQFGIIRDRAPHELASNAWSDGKNVRFREGYVEKFLGHANVFNGPTVPPYWLLPVQLPIQYFWLYAGLAKVYCWDGGAHTNITRQQDDAGTPSGGVDVDFTGNANQNWTGGNLGGIPFLNNGVNPPQIWNPPGASQRLTRLTNWPASTTCRALRSFKNYLVALDVTEGANRYPQMIRWSHPAAPGAVPSSWDYTDVTKDAGRVIVADVNDFFVDCVQLRDINVLYREQSIYGMQFIGGNDIFRIYPIFGQLGILSRRCAVEFMSGKHAVFGYNDMVVHDGQAIESVVNASMRRAVFNEIDSTYATRSFVAHVSASREVFFCYCTTGNSLPNKAVVWNYEFNTRTFRDLNGFAHIEAGIIDPGAVGDQWDNDSGSWESDPTIWDEALYSSVYRRNLIAGTLESKLFLLDSTLKFNGVNFESFVERQSIALPLKADGPPDMNTMKTFRWLLPRIDGTIGQTVNISIGYQEAVGAPISYMPEQVYTIGTSVRIPFVLTGRLLALKVRSNTDSYWRLHGYEVDVVARGKY